jgi:biotin operon repressor
MPDVLDDARNLIESRLAEIEAEVKQLENAVASMGEESVPRRRDPGRAPKVAAASQLKSGPRKRRPLKRARRGQRQAELLTAIKKMSGASASELADAIGIGSNQVHPLIRKAEAGGQIKKKGQGYALKGNTR